MEKGSIHTSYSQVCIKVQEASSSIPVMLLLKSSPTHVFYFKYWISCPLAYAVFVFLNISKCWYHIV